jgi:hypothetical protein
LALQHNVAVVQSYNLDATLSQVIDLVVSQAFKAVPEPALSPLSSHSNQTNTHDA